METSDKEKATELPTAPKDEDTSSSLYTPEMERTEARLTKSRRSLITISIICIAYFYKEIVIEFSDIEGKAGIQFWGGVKILGLTTEVIITGLHLAYVFALLFFTVNFIAYFLLYRLHWELFIHTESLKERLKRGVEMLKTPSTLNPSELLDEELALETKMATEEIKRIYKEQIDLARNIKVWSEILPQNSVAIAFATVAALSIISHFIK